MDHLEQLGYDFRKDTLFFQSLVFSALSTTKLAQPSSIILERRQTSLRPTSPKLCNSHQNDLDGYLHK